jgi:hypothetical protein
VGPPRLSPMCYTDQAVAHIPFDLFYLTRLGACLQPSSNCLKCRDNDAP